MKDILDSLESLTMLDSEDEMEIDKEVLTVEKIDRKQLKEKLLKLSKQKPLNKYEKIRSKILEEISDTFSKYLFEPSKLNFYEIFFYNDLSIQKHIIGSQRAGVHTALNDPQFYLQCACCELPNDTTILRTMPDICIMYKLHLEYGKMINLYDWLQAFLYVVDPVTEDDEDEKEVDPALQYPFKLEKYLPFLGLNLMRLFHLSTAINFIYQQKKYFP